MSLLLSEQPMAKEWLCQFDARSVHAARMLLEFLKLVPTDEMERSLTSQLIALCDKTEGRIAVFPVDKDKALQNRRARFERNKWLKKIAPQLGEDSKIEDIAAALTIPPHQRTRYTSAGRIGHVLESTKGLLPRRISVAPTLESMRAERVKEIVLVDDLIGSGKSISDYWKCFACPTILSWLSRKNCRIWLIAYAGHEEGIRRIESAVKFLSQPTIRIDLRLPAAKTLWPKAIVGLVREYGELTGRVGASCGFGNVMSPVVFQYRCPNSTPAILWDSSTHGWKGIFPNRTVPEEIQSCFRTTTSEGRHAELLWSSAQYKLALAYLESEPSRKKSEEHRLLMVVLGLLSRNISMERLSGLLLVGQAKLSEVLQLATELALITSDDRVTSFGADVLSRSRRTFITPPRLDVDKSDAWQYYFPHQFRGVRRKSSERTGCD
jgi:hypothetical protein